MHCQNGSVYNVRHEGKNWTREVHRPLCAEKALQIIPQPPRVQDPMFSQIILKEEGSNMSYLYVLEEATGVGRKVYNKCIYVARWSLVHAYLGHMSTWSAFWLKASSFSQIQLPQAVKYRYIESMLS